MKYTSFERIVLLVGGASVVATIAVTYGSELFAQEVVAQLLLLGVLFSAVHWGRRGGFVAAITASIAYIAMRIPLLPAETGPSTETIALILTRVLVYGIIGIVGGELATRMKYVLAELETSSSIDRLSGIYNERAFARILAGAQARFERYGETYSVVIMALGPGTGDPARQGRQRAQIRSVANTIRNDIRLVDDAGRLSDGRFAVLLPHTPKTGGDVVRERLEAGVRTAIGRPDVTILAHCLGSAEDGPALADLLSRVRETASQEY